MNTDSMDGKQRLLALNHVSKRYSGTIALNDVSFDLRRGETHCLVGENGAGKSTLMKILSGAESPDSGEIDVGGTRYRRLAPQEAMNLGIATIYQEVDVVDSLTLADNMFLGKELKKPWRSIDTRQQRAVALQVMERLNIHIDPEALVGELTAAQRQTLQILKALATDPKILIMDEPTASLGYEETEALKEMIASLTAKGVGIIYISHYLQEITELADRVTVLKDGATVSTSDRGDYTPEQLIHDMIGRSAELFYHRETVPIGEVGLEVQNYSRGDIVRDVSFDARHGEVFGIGGMVGSGRSELVNLMFGADKKDTGQLRLDGQTITPRNPRHAIQQGLCMIAEDRKEAGLFQIRPVRENVGIVRNEFRSRVLWPSDDTQRVSKMVDDVGVRLASINQPVSDLSGGNQQKTILARWLMTDAEVYIFDEPTKGVDIGAKEEIYELVSELTRGGKIVVMISSDLPELIALSDRIGVMRDGQMTSIVSRSDASEARLMREYLGHVPAPSRGPAANGEA